MSDTPWFAMACVPFWKTKRVKDITVILTLSVTITLRFLGAYLITRYVRNWRFGETCFTLLLYLLILMYYIAVAGVHPVKVIYIFLMLFILATFSNFLTGFIVASLIGAEISPYDTLQYTAALSVLLLFLLPFVYRASRSLMRRAFSELPNRTIAMLCFTPAVFFLLNPFITLSVADGPFTFVKVAVSLVGFAACYFNVYMTLDAAKHIQSENALFLEKRLAQDSYERVAAHLREVTGLKHDIKRHLTALRTYLEHGHTEEARDYLTRYAGQSAAVIEAVYSEHFLINAIIGSLYQRAGKHGIQVGVDLNAVPAAIADPDLYSLLSNITDNALEACLAMPEGRERFIRLTVTKRKPYLNIRCVNSKSGKILSAGGKIKTTKAGDGHGYGLQTIGRVTESYDGIMNIEHDENTFTLTLALKDQSR